MVITAGALGIFAMDRSIASMSSSKFSTLSEGQKIHRVVLRLQKLFPHFARNRTSQREERNGFAILGEVWDFALKF